MALPEALSRKEIYLSYLAGNKSVELPEPVTREDIYLHYMCIYGTGGGSVTPEQIQQAVNAYLEENPVTADTKEVDHGTSDTTFELTPNVKHKWGEVASLTLTLAAGKAGIVNEYMFSFISGDTATQVSVRTSDGELVKGLPAIEPNSRYEMSIDDNFLAYGRWDNNVTV